MSALSPHWTVRILRSVGRNSFPALGMRPNLSWVPLPVPAVPPYAGFRLCNVSVQLVQFLLRILYERLELACAFGASPLFSSGLLRTLERGCRGGFTWLRHGAGLWDLQFPGLGFCAPGCSSCGRYSTGAPVSAVRLRHVGLCTLF